MKFIREGDVFFENVHVSDDFLSLV